MKTFAEYLEQVGETQETRPAVPPTGTQEEKPQENVQQKPAEELADFNRDWALMKKAFLKLSPDARTNYYKLNLALVKFANNPTERKRILEQLAPIHQQLQKVSGIKAVTSAATKEYKKGELEQPKEGQAGENA